MFNPDIQKNNLFQNNVNPPQYKQSSFQQPYNNISKDMLTAKAKMINAQRDIEIAQLKGLAEQTIKKQSIEQKINLLKRTKYNNSSIEKYPRDIHYSKLLVDEKKKSPDKQGVLYIQVNENSDINKIEKIEEKYSLKNSLFIDPGLNIEELDEESNFESYQQKEKTVIRKKSLSPPNTSLDISFKTLKNSFQYSNIPKNYHTILTVLNWSIQDYHNLSSVYNKFLKKVDIQQEREHITNYILKSLLDDSTYHQFGGNKKSDNNDEPTVYNKISKVKRFKNIKKFKQKLNSFYDVVKKIKDISRKIDGIIFDNKIIFFIFYDLIVNKSFWILIPEKNKSFLNFLCSRMFEIIDESNDEIIHLIKAAEANQSIKEKGPLNVVKSIISKYHENISQEKLERIVNVILNLNNLKKDEAIPENFQLKIVTGSIFKKENSWSNKWQKISQKDKNKLFDLLPEENPDTLSTILFAIGSKGLIQYLLVACIYLLHKNKMLAKLTKNDSDNNFLKFIVEINDNDIFKRKNLKKISDDFKRQIAILTNNTEYISSPYKTFLNYIWKEFHAIEDSKKKKKSVFKKAKEFVKKVDKKIVKSVHKKSKKA
tara:strand:+ start:4763 stop:6553 length:1791 start_codon:yes stop_codon:yes gene_type:complete